MKGLLLALPALAAPACGTPTPQIMLALTDGAAQTCPNDCAKIPLPCNAVMSVRISDPTTLDGPGKRYLEQCERIQPDKKNDVCSLNMINLESTPLPVKDLEVQIAVFPEAALAIDLDTAKPVCPDIAYSRATGFPVAYDLAPALGGEAYYHPGDQVVKVVLGCTDLSAMNAGEACSDPAASALTATVDDFETRVPVRAGPDGADQLSVSIGEPHIFDGGYVLNPADVIPMHLGGQDTPQWTAASSQTFGKYACVEVLEDTPQAVSTLRCNRASDTSQPTGMWIEKQKLQSLLSSFSLPPDFPAEGLTIGMVVDAEDSGLANYIVTTAPGNAGGTGGTVAYMPAVAGGPATATSKSGIFLSRDAPFGTIFSARGQTPMATAVGGLVAGKVTVVLIQPMAVTGQ